jgi:hypothetical protein
MTTDELHGAVQLNRTGEAIMNTFVNKSLKVLACGSAAAAITLVTTLSFIQSTAEVRNTAYTAPTPWLATLQPGHTFGQPHPAVLVD